MFVGFAILGPLLIFFHANILLFDRNSFNCGRVIELRTIILQSMQHVWVNLFCRFLYIVHAEKGLLVRVGDKSNFSIRIIFLKFSITIREAVKNVLADFFR